MARRRARVSTSVLVCRGCCCGTESKHPDVDHDGHEERLRTAAEAAAGRVMTVDCLGPCERSNVVVVRRGTQRTWFGDLLDDDQIDRLGAWIASGSPDVPADLAAHRFEGPTQRARRRLLPERGDDLASWCVDVIGSGGTWTMGVVGALAEFDTGEGVDAALRPAAPGGDGKVVEAQTSTGAMRLVFDATTRAFAFGQVNDPDKLASRLLVRTSAGLPLTDGLTEVGRDGGALFDHEAEQTLFDLGLGRRAAHFMIRTGDDDLIDLLRQHDGTPVAEIDTDVFAAIVESSPTRVVRTAIGRIEVTAPIPPPDGESPAGSHTHLRPADLVLGLDLPHEMEVPAGWHLGPTHYPPPTATAAPEPVELS
ncbi:MAG: hypothetical protein AAGF91_03835 [Actinomycetota bacterium]